MKTKPIFLFLFLNFTINFFSQNYDRILKEGAFWDMKTVVVTNSCPDNIETIKRIQIAGDILIKGKLYKKLKYVFLEDETDDLCMSPPYFYNPGNFTSIKDKFIREDANEKKLFVLTKLENNFFEEFTVCDFSLNIGDELENYFGYNNSKVKLTVEDIKVDEKNMKTFYMNDGSYYTEGIGRNEGNLNIYHNLVDGTYERVHCNGNFYNPKSCATILEDYYEPILKKGAFWDMYDSNREALCAFNRVRIKIGTDTLINNRTYKKFKLTAINGTPDKSVEYCENPPFYANESTSINMKFTYISEDVENQKIYLWTTLRNSMDSFFGNEFIPFNNGFKEYTLFNFKAKKGESFSDFIYDNTVRVQEITTNAKGQKAIIVDKGIVKYFPNNAKSIEIFFNTFYLGGTNTTVFCYGHDGNQNNCAKTLNTKNYELSNIKVFPNPVNDILHITNTENLTVKVFSIDGKLIKKEKFEKDVHLDVTDLTQGVYFIELSKLNSKKRLKFLKL